MSAAPIETLKGATLSDVVLEETFNTQSGDELNKFAVTVTVDGKERDGYVMFRPSNVKPPMAGDSGDYEVFKSGNSLKLKKVSQQNGYAGGGGGGGNYRPTAPEDAKRMSRSKGLECAVAAANGQQVSSDGILLIAGKFADWIYGESVS